MTATLDVLGWVLLHFVWQGALIGLVTAAALQVLRHSSARMRHAAGCVSLAAMFVIPLVTARILATPRQVPATQLRNQLVELEIPRGLDPGFPQLFRRELPLPVQASSPAIPWRLPVIGIWIAGVLLFTLRLAGGLWRVRQVHRAAQQLPDSPWAIVGTHVAARLGVSRQARVVDAEFVDSPTLIGWSSPVIVLPSTALARLSPAQVEAVIAHELAHVRRRDSVINLVQACAEAVFFFHPGVWWLSGRIRAEREHCCDDLAVAACGDRVAYAEALAELETSRGTQPRLALAITGGSLLTRVRHVLTPAAGNRRRVNVMVVSALVVILVAAIGATEYQAMRGRLAGVTFAPLRQVIIRAAVYDRGGAGQDPGASGTFEVASVKPNRTGDSRGGIQSRDGRLVATNVPLRELIRTAYQLQDFQIAGDPSWAASDRFDVSATGAPGGDTQARLRALLAERFGLVARMETREMPVYELVAARDDRRLGDKVRPTTTDCERDGATCGFRRTPFSITGVARTMTNLATVLSTIAGRIVVDKTELTGTYDLDLRYTPDNGGQPVLLNGTAVDYPTIFTALQEQLGLKLEAARGQVPVLVIDKVTLPIPD